MELVKILEVRSNKSMTIPVVPQVKRVDTTNGNRLIESSTSVQASFMDNVIIIDSSTATEKVILDNTTLPIGKEITVLNIQGFDVELTPVPPITINGVTEIILSGAFSSAKIINTGTEFLIIG